MKTRKKIIQYTEGEIGPFRVVKDFLPPPEKLVLRSDTKNAREAAPKPPKRRAR